MPTVNKLYNRTGKSTSSWQPFFLSCDGMFIVFHVTSDRVKTWVGHGHYPGVYVWHFNEQDISNRNNLTFCCIVHIMTKFCELLEFNTKLPGLRGRPIKLKQTQTRDMLFMSLLKQMIFIQIQLVYKLQILLGDAQGPSRFLVGFFLCVCVFSPEFGNKTILSYLLKLMWKQAWPLWGMSNFCSEF